LILAFDDPTTQVEEALEKKIMTSDLEFMNVIQTVRGVRLRRQFGWENRI